ncbi:dipeptidase [Halioxenophilus sp. WMMB6]|uniref:dipeptidase n=1 Tax=Halioxenophilus sp. WMMB6 TaxID=3073815 RepID=UPI00295F3DF9|nr:dipeptidase [Halioxenophilus sp. WMMB6]
MNQPHPLQQNHPKQTRRQLHLNRFRLKRARQTVAGLALLTLLPLAIQAGPSTSFKAYLQSLNEPSQAATAAAFSSGKELSTEQERQIQHWLGQYTRAHYGDEALSLLAELVAIPTYRKDDIPSHENPAFIALGEKIGAIAKRFGLAFRNIDNRVFEVTLAGASDELVGIHAHGDVVPVNPANWVLDDGTMLDPFTVTTIGNRMYGRGTEDDKNGIVATLYAMKVIKEEGLPLARTFRLLVDTTEETTGTAIPYYFERNPTPQYNLALDGGYPVIIAEKGYGVVMASFPVAETDEPGPAFVDLTGGLATNQIPKIATTHLATPEPEAWLAKLQPIADRFAADQGGNFQVAMTTTDDGIDLRVIGESAHSSAPQSGVNPVSRLLLLIDQIADQLPVANNHIRQAAAYAADNWGLDFYGQKMGIAFEHPFMGPLTAAITQVKLDDQQLQLAVNLRVPAEVDLARLQQTITDQIVSWGREQQTAVDLDITLGEPMYRNPKGKWVNRLLDVATENLGLPREFASSAGGTSVHHLPNGVQFGLAMPGVKYTGHNANEFKTVDQFLMDLQIVTEMMISIGQLPELN